jgi:hypothetical protein
VGHLEVLGRQDIPAVELGSRLARCLRLEDTGPCATVDFGGVKHCLVEGSDGHRGIGRAEVDEDVNDEAAGEDVFELRSWSVWTLW